jgi:hypothetical protein
MRIYIITSFILILFFNIYDSYTTIVLLNNGGVESNPLLAWAMSHLGVIPAVVVVKGIFITILSYLCFKAVVKKLTKRELIAMHVGLLILLVFYSFCMYNYNYKQMLLLTQ